MKILQLCNKVPYPEKDGGAIGINVFTKALLSTGNKVKMLAMNTSKHFVEINSIPEKWANDISLETVFVDTSLSPAKALWALLSNQSYNITRFYSKAFDSKLVNILKAENFDIIQLEGLYLAAYIKTIRAHSSAPVILREHNIEWMIWKRLAEKETNILKKIYLKRLTHQLKKYEKNILTYCDGITTVTHTDMQRLKDDGCKTPIAPILFGIDMAQYTPSLPKKSPSLFYIGALDWRPNIQGLEWFLQNVWSKIHETYPNLEFHIAGRNMPEKYKATLLPNVIFHGEVENAIPFMNSYDIMVVPLLAGSGVRVKIIEGMALEKAIIATTIGIEGIECENEKEVLIANTPEDFYTSIKRYVDNPIFAKMIVAKAKVYIKKNHDIYSATEKLIQFYKERIAVVKKMNT